MARPTKAEPRRAQLNLSLTARELASIKKRAEAVGMRPVHFSRALLLDHERRVAVNRDAPHNVDRLIYGQLARLGCAQIVGGEVQADDADPARGAVLAGDVGHQGQARQGSIPS